MSVTVHTLPWKGRLAELGTDPLAGIKPRTYTIGGVLREFYTLGHLARVLNRKSVTIRLWERLRYLPPATFRLKGKNNDPRGARRLYTREQVLGLLEIAIDEGIYDKTGVCVGETNFPARAFKLFADLRKQEAAAA